MDNFAAMAKIFGSNPPIRQRTTRKNSVSRGFSDNVKAPNRDGWGFLKSVSHFALALEKFFRDLREEGVGENVLLGGVGVAFSGELVPELGDGVFLRVFFRAVVDDLVFGNAQHIDEEIAVDGLRRAAEFAAGEVLDFFRHHLVALAHHHVHRGHGADDLAGEVPPALEEL